MMMPVGLPESPKIDFACRAINTALALTDGECQDCCLIYSRKIYSLSTSGSLIFVPTIDIPPDSFGTPETTGFLNSNMLIYDPPTSELQKGPVLLTYFTKIKEDVPVDSPLHKGIPKFKVKGTPYA
jgi:hypothetical protein